ncbi:MAG TPA: undecaprenyl-phosphate glucose phosphotransferase [Alphaproteobacteria bacterium]|nr:undecaprenyl-phosphate glucose phosphotransferase [Alphaproteobacteria bacterium]
MKPVSRRLLADALRLADLIAIVAAGGIAFLIYVVGVLDSGWLNVYYLTATTVAGGLYVAIAQALRAYRYERLSDLSYVTQRALAALGAMAVIWLLVGFATRTTEFWSRGWTLLWLATCALHLVILRLALSVAISHWRENRRWQDRIVVVGATDIAERLIEDIREHGAADAEIVGIFDERHGPRRPALAGLPMIGDVDGLAEFTRTHHVDCVILALPWSSEERILRLSERLGVMPVDINLAFPTQSIHRRFRSWVSAYGVPLMQIGSKPLSDRQVFVKRLEDLVLGWLILAAISPVLLLTALAIRLESPGPALFRQPRHGFNDTIFNIYKFRTMYVDRADPTGRTRTSRNDPRVTRIGRFLRRWSIDELPQLLNVVKGDMSLIGPRPHPIGMLAADADYRHVVANYAARHRMKPGITGWAQVAGYRGETETVEKAKRRVDLDLEYIAHWSLLFDVRILLLTAATVISGKGAY